ncbi:ATP-dependent metallopeptidase FtsH/Yme1/Tma family protein, partial [Desulfotalea psychrophila]|nr:ATP-dependent metallopeptidase FtsH/Yme1/Tma family protein [Desulfotalea psychrophila]
MNTFYKNLSMWLVIGLSMILLFNLFNTPQGQSTSLTYSQFIAAVESRDISQVQISGDIVSGNMRDGTAFRTVYPVNDDEMISILRNSGTDISVKEVQRDSLMMTLFVSWFPMLLL